MTAKDGFDQLWGKLVDSASPKVEDEDEDEPKGGTKAWTDDVRNERRREAERRAEPDVEDEPPPPQATKLWTDEVRGQRKADAPTRRITPSSSSSALLGPDPERLQETADEEMARLMKPQPEARDDADRDPEPDPDRDPEPPAEARGVPEAEQDSPNRTFAWVAGASVLAFVAYLLFGGGDEGAEVATKPAAPTKIAKAPEPALASAKSPEEPEQREQLQEPAPPAKPTTPDIDPTPAHDEDEPVPEDGAADPPERSADDREIKRSGKPREVPPGTPPANATAFRKLAVSPADLPPVGQVGKNGVHVDRIGMGGAFEKTRCAGKEDGFSVSKDDRVNVCFRVVHPRQKEELVVLWQKDGGTVRRGKIVVKPAHAYRTRAYLILRREYVGTWKVRILDQDGVELASHPFKVVE